MRGSAQVILTVLQPQAEATRNPCLCALLYNEHMLVLQFGADLAIGVETLCVHFWWCRDGKQNVLRQQVALAHTPDFLQPDISVIKDAVGFALSKVEGLDDLADLVVAPLNQGEVGVNLIVTNTFCLEGAGSVRPFNSACRRLVMVSSTYSGVAKTAGPHSDQTNAPVLLLGRL